VARLLSPPEPASSEKCSELDIRSTLQWHAAMKLGCLECYEECVSSHCAVPVEICKQKQAIHKRNAARRAT
jgi:hypothetical protein